MKINERNFVFGLLVLFLVIGFIGNVSAITATIGNPKMVLYPETGDEIEKYVRVINKNDFNVDIEVFASGDLAEYIEIKDEKFTLEPGEEKNAYFTIDVKKSGKSMSKINVQFSPSDGEGNRAGLSSTVVVIAEGEDIEDNGLFDWFDNEDENNEEDENNKASGITGAVIGKKSKNISKVTVALLITLIVLIIFIVLLILYFVDKRRNEIKSKKSVRGR